MKFNMKKILSSALVVVLLFGAVIGVMPIKVNAAQSSFAGSMGATIPAEDLEKLFNETIYAYSFGSAEEMLKAELEEIGRAHV